MAEGGGDLFSVSLAKLDAELTCPVCTEHFKEPKVLPCLHYYCKTCIADLIKRAKGRPFNCPECRREAQAAGNDPESFQTAFFVNRMEEVFSVMKKAEPKENVKCESCSQFPAVNFCHDCSEYICAKCTDAHKRMRLLSSHKVVLINSLRSTISKSAPENLRVMSREVKCSKHADEPLKLYCRECHKLVCRDCIVIDHKDHTYAFVVDAAPRYKAEMKEKAKSVKKISVGLKLAVKSLSDSEKRLTKHGTATERAIDDAIDRVIAKAGQKRKELKKKASGMVSEARKKVITQEKNAELAVGEVESLLEFMGRSLERTTDQEVLSLEKQVSDQVERVSQLYGNPAWKFPVPKLPELVVHCGAEVEQVIDSEISIAKKGSELPDYWAPMVDPFSKKEVALRVIDLATSGDEYKCVLSEFHKTMTQGTNYTAVVHIQRIQNPALYGQYAAKKEYLDSHNPEGVQNERWLFHGTKEDIVSHINKVNFNRSLCGQNGTVYGRGCYFARDASYSNRDQYAVPDSKNKKRMYLVRVLTGEFTRGSGSMVIPPPKDPSDPTVLYDSVVDNTSNPGIFVVFYDADAYPEYLITYKI